MWMSECVSVCVCGGEGGGGGLWVSECMGEGVSK